MKTLITPTPYGYQEIRLVYQRNMMLAMSIAISIQILVIGGYHLNAWLKPEDNPGFIIPKIPFELLPLPPSLTNPIPNIGTAVTPTKFSEGIPIPVPDCEVNPEIEFTNHPTQNLNNQNTSGLEGVGTGDVIVIPPDPNDPSPDKFEPFEKEPIPVLTPAPQYPDVPRRAGIEGNVLVKVLITKEGKVKRVLLIKSDCELFVQPSIDAAMKWVFTPALMNGKPVPVWVAIPFRYRLTMK